MIHLDTNFLIDLVTLNSGAGPKAMTWIQAGEELSVSAIAWSEFLTGSITPDQLRRAEAILAGGIIPFRREESVCAAQLFNLAGRKRDLRVDSLIAATAILAKARLATRNDRDFLPFLPAGLRLA